MYHLGHRLVGITPCCHLIIAWLIQMIPWLWLYSAPHQCLKMPSCLSWNRGASRGFLTLSTSVWDIVCPLLSSRSVQCIFLNLALKWGRVTKCFNRRWKINWILNVCNGLCVVLMFWLFGLDMMRLSKTSSCMSYIQGIDGIQWSSDPQQTQLHACCFSQFIKL